MAGPEVGSVYIRVKAITDKFAPDLEKALSSLNTGSSALAGDKLGQTFTKSLNKALGKNTFEKVGQALADFGGEAGSARAELASLTTTGYTTGTAMAVLLGAMSSLIGGIGGLAGSIAGAVPAIMGMVGALVSLRVGIAVGEMALNGISQAVSAAIAQQKSYAMSLAQAAKQTRDLAFATEDAQHAVGRANLNFEQARANLLRTQDLPASSFARREALQQYADAELSLREAKQKVKDAKAEQANPRIFTKTPDPFFGLTESQKTFAKYVLSLKGDMQKLTEAAASGFLPILKTNIQELVSKLLPTLTTGFHEIGTGLGLATTNLKTAILDPANLSNLKDIMHNIAGDLPKIGEIIGHIYGTFLTILNASHPLVKDFLAMLDTKVKTLDEWLKSKQATGELQTFFDTANATLKQIEGIFDNTFSSLGAIIQANFGKGTGGQIMLDWLTNVTSGWTNLNSSVDKKDALKKYFIDTAKNSKSILDAVGGLVKQFLILGQDQNIGKTFDALGKGAPAMGELGKKLIDAGPALGKLVADITKFINKMTDSQAIKNFFGTIDDFVRLITTALNDPIVGPILTILGQIHGTMFAIMKGAEVTGFLSKYMGETFKATNKVLDAFGLFPGTRKSIAKAFDAVKSTAKDAATYARSRMGEITDGIVTGMKKAGSAIGSAFSAGASKLKDFAVVAKDGLSKGLSAAGGAMKTFGAAIWNGVRASIAFLIANPWIAVAAALVALIALTVNFFANTKEGKKMWGDFMNFMGDVWKTITGFFQAAWDWLSKNWPTVLAILTGPIGLAVKWIIDNWSGITKTFTDVFNAVGKWANDTWNGITTGISNFVKGIPGFIAGIPGFFVTAFNGIVSFISGIWTKIIGTVTGFVTGVVNGVDKIFPGFKTVFNNVINFFKTVIINPMIGMVEGFINMFIRGINFLITGLNKLKITIPDWIPKALGGGQTFGVNIPAVPAVQLPRLAAGGTVMPSSGGSLVNVAEAGRPERIEPLDANGLSNRDKAMIKYLSGNASGARPIQLNVYPSAGMDEKELAAVVSRTLAFQLSKGVL